MIVKYNAIDIANFYEGIPRKQMYIVLSRDRKNANCQRKIKISRFRVLKTNYFEDEKVQVLVWDDENMTYQCMEIKNKAGKYRINSIIQRSFPEARDIYWGDYKLVIDFFRIFTEEVVLTEHVIASKGMYSEVKSLKDIKVVGSNLLLKKLECEAYGVTHIDDLYNKCICSQTVNLEDFQLIVDDMEGREKVNDVRIEFDNMIFGVDTIKKTISVQLLMDSQGKINETVSFTISTGRLGGMTFFLLLKLAEIESVEDKLKYLTGRILY